MPEDVLADPLVQEAIAAVSAIRLDTAGVVDGGAGLVPAKTVLPQPVPSTPVWTGARAVLEGPEFPPGFEPIQQRGLDTTEEGAKANGFVVPKDDQQNTVMEHGQVAPRDSGREEERTKELEEGGKIRKMGDELGQVKTQAVVLEANTKDLRGQHSGQRGRQQT